MNVYALEGTERNLAEFSLTIESCRFEKGLIYAVTGPNGCGKTTLLNLLSLVDRPSKGEVVFNGERVDFDNLDQLLSHRRRIGYLMQNPYLFNMNVYDNISYGLKIRALLRKDVREQVERIMDRLLLTHLAKRSAHNLSGGEAQRVALARTLVLDVDVFLMDEPTANVDQRNIHVVEALITELNKERNVTVILTTHSLDQAYRMSRNLVSVVDGKISDVGYENVFSGVLEATRDGLNTVTLTEKVKFNVAKGRKGHVTVAIDPYAIILSNDEVTSSALNKFKGIITKIEDVNGSLRVFIDTGVILCALITRRSYLNMDMNIGKSVWVTFKANAVKLIGI